MALKKNNKEKGKEWSDMVDALSDLESHPSEALLGKIVDLAYAEWKAEQPSVSGLALPADHYRVVMTYAPMPPRSVLERMYGHDHVSGIFAGDLWELHSSCIGMSRTPGDGIFLVDKIDRDWGSEERIAWGRDHRTAVAPNGYRPATHEEAYEFQKAHQKLTDLVALGSFTLHNFTRIVGVVSGGVAHRFLGDSQCDGDWGAKFSVLFVALP